MLGTGGLSQPPISRPSLRDQQDLSRRGSQPDRLSQELGPRRSKRSSPIDSGASDLDTEDYLKQYQHSTPMKPGTVLSVDIFRCLWAILYLYV